MNSNESSSPPRVPGSAVEVEADETAPESSDSAGTQSEDEPDHGFRRQSTGHWSPRKVAPESDYLEAPDGTSARPDDLQRVFADDELESVDAELDGVFDNITTHTSGSSGPPIDKPAPPPLPNDAKHTSAQEAASRLARGEVESASRSRQPLGLRSRNQPASGIQLDSVQESSSPPASDSSTGSDHGATAANDSPENTTEELAKIRTSSEAEFDIRKASAFRTLHSFLCTLEELPGPHIIEWYDADQEKVGEFVAIGDTICPGIFLDGELFVPDELKTGALRHTLASLKSSGGGVLDVAGDPAWDGLLMSREQLECVHSLTAEGVARLCERATHFFPRTCEDPSPGPVAAIPPHALLKYVGRLQNRGSAGIPHTLYQSLVAHADRAWLLAKVTPIGLVPVEVKQGWNLPDFIDVIQSIDVGMVSLAKARGTTFWVAEDNLLVCAWNERLASLLCLPSSRLGLVSRAVQALPSPKGSAS